MIANGPPEPKGGSGAAFPRTKTADHIASVNWAVAENSRKDSKYYQKLDTSKIAMMGQSCGGIQTLEVSNDPRFTTIVMWNSGVLSRMPGPPPGAAGPAGRRGSEHRRGGRCRRHAVGYARRAQEYPCAHGVLRRRHGYGQAECS